MALRGSPTAFQSNLGGLAAWRESLESDTPTSGIRARRTALVCQPDKQAIFVLAGRARDGVRPRRRAALGIGRPGVAAVGGAAVRDRPALPHRRHHGRLNVIGAAAICREASAELWHLIALAQRWHGRARTAPLTSESGGIRSASRPASAAPALPFSRSLEALLGSDQLSLPVVTH